MLGKRDAKKKFLFPHLFQFNIVFTFFSLKPSPGQPEDLFMYLFIYVKYKLNLTGKGGGFPATLPHPVRFL